METHLFTSNKKFSRIYTSTLLFLIAFMIHGVSFSQTNTIAVKGVVKDINGPLEGVSIYLKGSKSGTVSKAKGDFTFPEQLKYGDVLVFSYLGYKREAVTINKDASFIELIMTEEAIDVLSDLNTNRPYKSKRKRN